MSEDWRNPDWPEKEQAMSSVAEMIEKEAWAYCDDVQRATGDVSLSPELLGEIMTNVAEAAAREALDHLGEHGYPTSPEAYEMIINAVLCRDGGKQE